MKVDINTYEKRISFLYNKIKKGFVLALEIVFNVKDQATPELKKLQTQLKQLQPKINDVDKGFLGLNKSLVIAGVGFLSLSKAIDLGRDFIAYADAMTLVDTKLKLATDSTEELTTAQTELFKIAQLTRTEFTSSADLFERLSRSTRDYSIEQKELLDLTETINKSMIISGGTAESMNASIIQLGQAFSADFQSVGQELASIREQTPRLYQAFLEGTGKTSKEFKKMAEEGELSTKIILEALRTQATAVNSEFNKVNLTVSQSQTVFGNSMQQMVGNIDEALGVTSTLSTTIVSIAGNIDSLGEKISNNKEELREWAYIALTPIAGIELFVTSISVAFDTIPLYFEDATLAMQKIWLKFILEIQKSARDVLPKVLADKMGFDSDSIQNTRLELQALRDAQIALSLKVIEAQDPLEELTKKYLALRKSMDKVVDGGHEVIEVLEMGVFELPAPTKKEIDKFADSFIEGFSGTRTTKEFEQWVKDRNKFWAEELKEDSPIVAMFDNVGDIAKNQIVDAIQAGFDGDFNMQSFTSNISKSVGQAMLMSGTPVGIGAGLGLMAVGGFLGRGGEEGKTSQELANESLEKFAKELSNATKRLDSFGNVGTSFQTALETLNEQIWESQVAVIGAMSASKEYRDSLRGITTDLQEQKADLILEEIASSLDFSQFSSAQLESVIKDIDIPAYQALKTELNEIALVTKMAGGELKDNTRVLEIWADTNFQAGEDYAEAINIVNEAEQERMDTLNESALRHAEATNIINREMLGSLTYLNEAEKLIFANNIYRNAITQEDRVSGARTLAEISVGTTRTREEYIPIFTQYINELEKQRDEATLTNVVDKLDEVVDAVEALEASTIETSINLQGA